jgi:hypothetical protein
MKPQEGICFPFAPWRRGPDGLLLEEQGIMLNVAPVSTKYLSFVNASVRQIKPASAGRCMMVAVACAALLPSLNQLSDSLVFRLVARFYTPVGTGSNCDTCTHNCRDFEN